MMAVGANSAPIVMRMRNRLAGGRTRRWSMTTPAKRVDVFAGHLMPLMRCIGVMATHASLGLDDLMFIDKWPLAV